ncbi:MAG: CoA transferase, partial [bacterium]|nr:CoA transferase [bacterium]
MTLDLKSPEGRRQAQHLARRSDVVVASFRPAIAERLGIDYEVLAAQHPDLIYCSITGFGPRGPYAKYKGYDAVVAAKIGRMMVGIGQSRPEGPQYMAVNVASHAAAMAMVRGITAALLVRDRTGQGQKVETSL